VFVPGKPLQPSLMYVSKAGTEPSKVPFICSTVGSQTIDYAGKDCQGQTP
jgi:hypothetical protein